LSFHWRIIATDEYIDQVSKLDIKVQDKILNSWIEVAKHSDPRDIGSNVSCTKKSDYVLVIFPGLTFEFVYKIDNSDKTIRLLNCEKLAILDHGQPDLF